MATRSEFDITGALRDAWVGQTQVLQRALRNRAGAIHLEFAIPRMGTRADAVIVIGPVVFVVEFKVGEREFV